MPRKSLGISLSAGAEAAFSRATTVSRPMQGSHTRSCSGRQFSSIVAIGNFRYFVVHTGFSHRCILIRQKIENKAREKTESRRCSASISCCKKEKEKEEFGFDTPSPVDSMGSDLDRLSLDSGSPTPPSSSDSSAMDISKGLRLPLFTRLSDGPY
ncbi:uncharacterized protein LOC136028917 isoform X2 [Artemia franciscana]|uniref:Uncharacterized protein n=2 Tax=Artemia franciscana TaxID=6661 RepID=A0AA88HIK5_ARTSF|nr:hypothetical protein QYM36_015402 [Artemia franciscana]